MTAPLKSITNRLTFLCGITILPFADQVVIGKRPSGIPVGTNVDILLLLLLALILQYLRKMLLSGGIGQLLLGLVLLVLGSNLSKRRDHRDRLNFIKRFMSVCFGLSLPGWYAPASRKIQRLCWRCFVLFCYIYRQKRGFSEGISIYSSRNFIVRISVILYN